MRSGGLALAFPKTSLSPPSRSSAAPCWSMPSRRGGPARGGEATAAMGGTKRRGRGVGARRLRLWLERQPIGYVLAVTSKQRAPSGFDSVKIRTRACFGADDWRRLSAGEGAKGPRLYDWAYKDYPSLQPG